MRDIKIMREARRWHLYNAANPFEQLQHKRWRHILCRGCSQQQTRFLEARPGSCQRLLLGQDLAVVSM